MKTTLPSCPALTYRSSLFPETRRARQSAVNFAAVGFLKTERLMLRRRSSKDRPSSIFEDTRPLDMTAVMAALMPLPATSPMAMHKLLRICFGVLMSGRPFDLSLYTATLTG